MSGFNSDPGSSKSTNSQTTTSIDGRVVGGDQSTNFSLNGNTAPVSIVTTDDGAVHDALSLALAGVTQANKNASDASSSAMSAVQAGQAQFTSAIEQIKTGDKTTGYVIAGAAAVAIAFAMSRKG
jgi:D-aminopeptidase